RAARVPLVEGDARRLRQDARRRGSAARRGTTARRAARRAEARRPRTAREARRPAGGRGLVVLGARTHLARGEAPRAGARYRAGLQLRTPAGRAAARATP